MSRAVHQAGVPSESSWGTGQLSEVSTQTAFRENRRAVVAWCVFDWANSSIPTIITTFVFSAYFTTAVAPNPELGTALWGQANSIAALVTALMAPLLGAIADQSGRQKPWLLVFSMLCIVATASLWFVRPEESDVVRALVIYGIAVLGFEMALVFYNAMLPELAGPERVGRVSGWGWGLGYLGGLTCLVICLVIFVQPNPSPFGLDRDAAEHVRITNPFAAIWFAVFAVPLFLLVPDRASGGLGWIAAARAGSARLIATIRRLRSHRNVMIFLCAKMIYIDGLNTLFAFGGVYAAATFGMSFDEILVFAIMLNVSSGLGAIAFAWIDDWLGAKPTILTALAGMTVLSAAILVVEIQDRVHPARYRPRPVLRPGPGGEPVADGAAGAAGEPRGVLRAVRAGRQGDGVCRAGAGRLGHLRGRQPARRHGDHSAVLRHRRGPAAVGEGSAVWSVARRTRRDQQAVVPDSNV